MNGDLTPDELRRVLLVYGASLLPLAAVLVLQLRGKLPRWIAAVYVATFVVCAVGWEIWFTFGLVEGLPVEARRSAAMNAAIPQGVNWLLNSLADAGIGLFGLILVGWAYRGSEAPMRHFRWPAFAILLGWFLAQNLWVELRLYHTQLAPGMAISWAPLAPTGPFFNPLLFEIAGRPVHLHTQLPWLLMTPIFYAIARGCFRRFGDGAAAGA
jgi:hypothetical protein